MTSLEFNDCYKEIESLLFGFAIKLTKDKESAKDLMQETFCRAFKHRDRFSKNTNFKAWMTYHYDEIAKASNVPIGTVKSRIFFARKKLRASIKANYDMTTYRKSYV